MPTPDSRNLSFTLNLLANPALISLNPLPRILPVITVTPLVNMIFNDRNCMPWATPGRMMCSKYLYLVPTVDAHL
jgi:hypothetical protein